mmetsp:Transcript_1835/g.6102  ORF Transcript_1835/g.6102 Transcript_1835/m.6102 type:complete len:259 (+) Transcript_1835:324-1100(+)
MPGGSSTRPQTPPPGTARRPPADGGVGTGPPKKTSPAPSDSMPILGPSSSTREEGSSGSTSFMRSRTALWRYCAGRILQTPSCISCGGAPRSHAADEPRSTVPASSRSSGGSGNSAEEAAEGSSRCPIQLLSMKSAWRSPSAWPSGRVLPACGCRASRSLCQSSMPLPMSATETLEPSGMACRARARSRRELREAWACRSLPRRRRWSAAAMIQLPPRSSSSCSCPGPQPQYPTSSRNSSRSATPEATSSRARDRSIM